VALAIVRLLRDHPAVGIDIFLGRDGERDMRHAAFLMGADLDRAGVEVRPTVTSPWQIYERARVVLVPSLFEDPAPRVVAEAFANGVTVVGSDRGGIPEMCADAGIVVPVPRSIHPLAFQMVPDAIARPWVDAILGFYQSDAVWRSAVDRGREVARVYLPPAATEAYTDFFERAARDRHRLRRVAGASTQTRAASQLPPVARHS
jgi:glycosyltransferase involved in cell wall biosynthesis